jgi:hypothetical protein
LNIYILSRGRAFSKSGGQSPESEVEPVAQFRERVTPHEVVVKSSLNRSQKIQKRSQSFWKFTGKSCGRAFPDFQQMTKIP